MVNLEIVSWGNLASTTAPSISIYIWIFAVALWPIYFGIFLTFDIWLGKFIDRRYRRQLIIKSFESEQWLEENLEDIVYITGDRGIGKSALAACFANDNTFKKKKMANKRVNDLKLRFLDKIDLRPIDELIKIAFWDLHFTNTDAVLRYVKENNTEAMLIDGDDYYDYLYPQKFEDELRDYCAAQIALTKNNYVIDTQGGFKSQITGNYAMTYDPKSFDIRESYRAKSWRFLPYTIILDDDRNIQVGNSNERGANVSGLSSGKSVTYRVNRHLFKGHLSGNSYITTSQKFKRSPEGQRESALSVFTVERIETGLGLPWRNALTQLKLATKNYFKVKKGQPINEYEALKRKRVDDRKNKRDFAESFIAFHVRFYGNKLDEADNHAEVPQKILYFPLTYAFASYDTYSFAFIERYLSQLALDDLDNGQWRDPEDKKRYGLDTDAQADLLDSIVNVNHFKPKDKPRPAPKKPKEKEEKS